MAKMKALITGVNGFVGSYLSNFLVDNGFQVFGTDLTEKNSGKFSFFKADITEKEEISNIIKKIRPDLIFHLAGIASPSACEKNPELAGKVNVSGTENLLYACVENKINPRILITSSAYVYGVPKYTPIDENHPANPVNEYGKSKLEQEKVALRFFKELGIKSIISRSFNHIGPGQALGFVCSDFAKQIADIEKGGIKPEIHVRNLSPVRDFTDVRDIANAYLLLIENGKPGEIYNIGSGKGILIRDILNKLIGMSSKKIRVIQDKSEINDSVPVLIADNKKLVKLTGWKPKISIDESLRDILEYWRKKAAV